MRAQERPQGHARTRSDMQAVPLFLILVVYGCPCEKGGHWNPTRLAERLDERPGDRSHSTGQGEARRVFPFLFSGVVVESPAPAQPPKDLACFARGDLGGTPRGGTSTLRA